MLKVSLSFSSILQSSSFPNYFSLSPVSAVSDHMLKSSTGVTVPPLVYFHHIRVSPRSPYSLSLSLSSHYYYIHSLNSLHQSGLYCCPLRWHILPPLPHLGSWQYLSLLLLFRSYSPLLFLSPQSFFLSSTLPPISV